MNEAFNPNGTATSALLALRLIAGKGETETVIDMYADAARLHGVCPSDCREAIAEGRQDRADALAAAATTQLTVDEVIADIHADLVASARRQRVIGLDRGTRYLVCDENTLCYQVQGDVLVGILAGKLADKGILGRSWRDGTTSLSTFQTVRPATVEDFHAFRVNPKGHIVY